MDSATPGMQNFPVREAKPPRSRWPPAVIRSGARFRLSGVPFGRAVPWAAAAAGLAVIAALLVMPDGDGVEHPPGETAAEGGAGVSAPPGRAALARCASPGRAWEDAPPGGAGRARILLGVSSARDLAGKLSALGYSLREVRLGAAVPRVQVAGLPPDMAAIGSAGERKRLFVMAVLPLVLQVNEQILADRKALLGPDGPGGMPAPSARRRIAALAARHGADPADRDELLARVDAVPPSLAIAQAVEESGWGRSRFAVEANAVFGQWTFRAGSGVVPGRRGEGERHEVRSFDGPRQSVAAYMRNLNSHWAYEEFRRRRRALRLAGEALTGEALVGTLQRYSERGPGYVETIRTIMRQNRLADFDRAHLEPPAGCP